MQSRICLFAGLAALALTACGPDPDTAGPSPPGASEAETTDVGDPPASEALEPTGLPPTTGAVPADDGPASMAAGGAPVRTFSCESGHRVELVGEDMARVTLADGRVIELPRKSDGVAEYRGEALTFDLGDDGGVLGQDEVGGFDCEPAG